MFASRLRAALLLLLIFAAGAAAGVAADRLHLLPGAVPAEAAAEGREARERRERHETTIERFADDLELTGPQRAEIEGILERYRAELKGMRREIRPRFRALVDSVRTEIETVLTPEQVEEYRALLAKHRTRREHGTEEDR